MDTVELSFFIYLFIYSFSPLTAGRRDKDKKWNKTLRSTMEYMFSLEPILFGQDDFPFRVIWFINVNFNTDHTSIWSKSVALKSRSQWYKEKYWSAFSLFWHLWIWNYVWCFDCNLESFVCLVVKDKADVVFEIHKYFVHEILCKFTPKIEANRNFSFLFT